MRKEKICIDSCVFFHLMRYNDALEKDGPKKLLETIKADEQRYLDSVKNFENFMQPLIEAQEKKAGKKLPFEKKMALVSSMMKNKSLYIPENVREMYKTLNNEYAHANSYAGIGKLYIKYLNKSVDLCLTPTTKREIEYHRDEYLKIVENGELGKDPKKDALSADSINSMLKRCHPIEFQTDREKEYIIKLSEVFRGKRKIQGLEDIEPAMANDINKLGIYGDSMIMAESALAGIPFITQNAKDFIINKGQMFDKNNQVVTKRRDIIQRIVNELGLSNNALPYSVDEFINNSADIMELERVLTMDEETFELLFRGIKKPENTNNQNYPTPKKPKEYGEDGGMSL